MQTPNRASACFCFGVFGFFVLIGNPALERDNRNDDGIDENEDSIMEKDKSIESLQDELRQMKEWYDKQLDALNQHSKLQSDQLQLQSEQLELMETPGTNTFLLLFFFFVSFD